MQAGVSGMHDPTLHGGISLEPREGEREHSPDPVPCMASHITAVRQLRVEHGGKCGGLESGRSCANPHCSQSMGLVIPASCYISADG